VPADTEIPERVACAEDVENRIQNRDQRKPSLRSCRTNSRRRRIHYSAEELLQDWLLRCKTYGARHRRRGANRLGRTGKKMVRHRRMGSHSDMITAAKGMANGVPIRLDVTNAEIAGGFKE